MLTVARRRMTKGLVQLGRRVLGARQLNHLVRFEPVLELIATFAPDAGTLIDIGSGSRGVATLLPVNWRVTAVDANFGDYGAVSGPVVSRPDRVIADVRALPFEDRTFDVAVAIDLLEHLPAVDRDHAISEVCRVARRYAILACPAGRDALAADRRLAERLGTRARGVPAWLTEHLDNGFPDPEDMKRVAATFGSVRVLGNESITAHERLILAETSLISGGALRLACGPLEALIRSRRHRARRFGAWLLRAARGGDRAPTYRTIVVVDFAVDPDLSKDPKQQLGDDCSS